MANGCRLKWKQRGPRSIMSTDGRFVIGCSDSIESGRACVLHIRGGSSVFGLTMTQAKHRACRQESHWRKAKRSRGRRR